MGRGVKFGFYVFFIIEVGFIFPRALGAQQTSKLARDLASFTENYNVYGVDTYNTGFLMP